MSETDLTILRSSTDWHIMSNPTLLAVASQVPTTVDELYHISGLGESVIKEYGERLVKNINAFVELEGLQEYLDKRPKKRPRTETAPAKKRAAAPKAADVIDVDADGDEFDTGIDFNAIRIEF